MTKKELIDSLAKYADDTELYNVSNTADDFIIFDGDDFVSYQRDDAVKYWTDRVNRYFVEVEEANAKMVIANEHLAKKETKKWRIELDKATLEHNSKNSLFTYSQQRLAEMKAYSLEHWKKQYGVK